MEANGTESSLNGTEVNRTSAPIFTIGTDFITQWKLRKQQRLCRYVYNQILTAECTQLNRSWPDPDDPHWGSSEYTELLPDWFSTNVTNTSLAENLTFSTQEPVAPFLPPFELWQTVLIALCLAICILLTVGGNILVLLAFIVDRGIRNPSNYFIASLAATDMLIGTVSMPFYTIYVLMGYWNLGPLLCDLWLSVDYTVCLVSQYTVLLITIDRFCSVKIAAQYRSWRTKDRVIWMVTITWIIPALLFFISIFGWEHFIGYRDLAPGQCAVQFLKDPVFNTALIIGYYWITLIVLFILYGCIYKTAHDMQKKSEAKQRKMKMVALSAGAMSGMAGCAAGIGITKTSGTTLLNQDKAKADGDVTDTVRDGTSPNTEQTGDQKTSSRTPGTTGTEDNTGKNYGNLLSTETEKSERSSSPAFDSDDESSIAPVQQVPSIRKRSSLAGLVVQSGALQVFATNGRLNGMVTVKADTHSPTSKKFFPSSPTRETSFMIQKGQTLPKIQEISLLDTDIPAEPDKTSSRTLTPEQSLKSNEADVYDQRISPESTPTAATKHSTTGSGSGSGRTSIIPPPSQFQSSPAVTDSSATSSSSDRPESLGLSYQGHATFDILSGLDGADLSLANPLSTAPSSPILGSGVTSAANTSLLQAALINATAQQSHPTTGQHHQPTMLNGSSQTHPPRVFITDRANASSQTSPTVSKAHTEVTVKPRDTRRPPITTVTTTGRSTSTTMDRVHGQIGKNANNNYSSNETKKTLKVNTPQASMLVSKVNTEVSLKAEDARRQPVTMVVNTTSIDSSNSTMERSSDQPTKVSNNPPQDSSSSGIPTISGRTCVHDEKKQGSRRKEEISDSEVTGSRRNFAKSIGKRLRGKTKKDPLLGRMKSRTENRANKALTTISFILGAFVACWTPYHVLALVEGFCPEPPCTNEHLFMFSYFLCYANSPMNPFCYALANKQFKKTFTRILKGDLHMT
ncbi:muscarinic acetylcholine receptor gar-2 isoform X2 [Prorops nasuta]|uniref:muscarinic acetylcholine receptor gar-2 isoform X2 n=1 Tax=Prorops nasuta TaxID=863751 RepID=UPI0034CF44E8